MTAVPDILLSDQNLRIFPNPAIADLTIEYTGSSPYSIALYDFTGKCVRQFENLTGHVFNLNTASLTTGIYLVRLTSPPSKIYIKKIVIEN